MKLSIVVPCFNEEPCIEHTIQRLEQLACDAIGHALCSSVELIFVDDGSRDNTANIISACSQQNSAIQLITLSRNFGHQAALLAGYSIASGDTVVSLDADLQDPPEVILTFLKKYHDGADIVYGVRSERSNDSWLKRTSARGFYTLMAFLGVEVIAHHADFRLISKRALQALLSYGESNMFIRATLPLVGFSSAQVPYERAKRYAGVTKYPIRKMLAFATSGIMSFSLVPLRLCTLLGAMFFISSLGYIIWNLVTKSQGSPALNWTFIVATMYLLGGIQLLFIGVLGEYLGKVYLETKKRPAYIIKNILRHTDTQ